MTERRLDPEESALWQRVAATVRPIARRLAKASTPSADPAPLAAQPRGHAPPLRVPAATAVSQQMPLANALDGGWDRRLRRGTVEPDWTIDLHGHTLDSAQRMLDKAFEQALVEGVRVILLITGKPPREGDQDIDGRPRRGRIRAAIGTWLESSRHARHIAAVRNAHPRHGGMGALYVILRRNRG